MDDEIFGMRTSARAGRRDSGPKTSLSTPSFSAPFARSFPAIRSSRSPSPSTRGIVTALEMLFIVNGRTTAGTMMDLGFKIGSGDATSSKGCRLNTSPGTQSRRSQYKSGSADDGDAPQMDSGLKAQKKNMLTKGYRCKGKLASWARFKKAPCLPSCDILAGEEYSKELLLLGRWLDIIIKCKVNNLSTWGNNPRLTWGRR
ncbi:hypothetical protein DFP72DRAFT_1079283 [Ephemerocybe angulata]|uniref:Uncharacterized protein n=1 Tax=Ephemerocybe angulata TaxID=980116 RepID=A0A8H6HDW0_9AGAR|nr:hypothetical protein DFP72DRAFT_1079283 [Tulosesus angulatus]